ncbi:MAG: hypothetical protein Q4G63_02915, partial [Bacteroidia bacterium]|nr:hypothetical protein [Bacteroidia bacterium]
MKKDREQITKHLTDKNKELFAKDESYDDIEFAASNGVEYEFDDFIEWIDEYKKLAEKYNLLDSFKDHTSKALLKISIGFKYADDKERLDDIDILEYYKNNAELLKLIILASKNEIKINTVVSKKSGNYNQGTSLSMSINSNSFKKIMTSWLNLNIETQFNKYYFGQDYTGGKINVDLSSDKALFAIDEV